MEDVQQKDDRKPEMCIVKQMPLYCQEYAKHWLRAANLSDTITVLFSPPGRKTSLGCSDTIDT